MRRLCFPAHAPPEFADRLILWNSVEQIEKARDSRELAREIQGSLARELSGEQARLPLCAHLCEGQRLCRQRNVC